MGSAVTQVFVAVSIDAAPAWTAEDVVFTILEGESETFDLKRYLVAGSPAPKITLGTGIVDVPVTVYLAGATLAIMAPSDVAVQTTFTIPLVATNDQGTAALDAQLVIDPRIALGELTHFQEGDYNQIRSLLDLRLTDVDLPDSVISQAVYEQAAFAWVANACEDITSRLASDETVRYKKRAAIYRCAGLIAPAVSKLVSESAGSLTERFEFVDWRQLQRNLYERAQEAVDTLEPVDSFFGFFEIG